MEFKTIVNPLRNITTGVTLKTTRDQRAIGKQALSKSAKRNKHTPNEKKVRKQPEKIQIEKK